MLAIHPLLRKSGLQLLWVEQIQELKQDLLGTTPSISYSLSIMERSLQAVVEFGLELTMVVLGDMDSTLAEARTDKSPWE